MIGPCKEPCVVWQVKHKHHPECRKYKAMIEEAKGENK